MLTVYFRMIIKLSIFLFAAFFIIFFVVYWYRFDRNVWFIKKNVYMEFKFWSDNNSINFDWRKFFSNDKYIRIYNLDSWCYDLQYMWKNYTKCFKDDQSFQDVFVIPFWVKNVSQDLVEMNCDRVKNLYFRDYSLGERVFSEKITNAFLFNEINFVQTQSWLSYCNDKYTVCRFLEDVKWEFICWNDEGLVFYNSWYNLLRLK